MSDVPTSRSTPTLSPGALAKRVIGTLAGAALVTVLFVMPAEYGIDPTGIGARLGLTRLGSVEAPESDPTPRVVTGTWPAAPAEAEFDFFDPEVLGDPFSRTHDRPFQSETLTIELAEFEQVEVKASMRRGDALVYAWNMTAGETVYSDFHADPHQVESYPESYWIRYLEREGASATGSLVAPFDGNHGWYWLNIEENPVTIELRVHGFFDSVGEIMRSFQ